MSKHTPRPWIVDSITDSERYNLPKGPIHQVLATVNGCPSTVCTIEEYNEVPGFNADRLADARLIAAAPDLLEALKRANKLLAELTFSEWIPRTYAPSIDIRQRISAAHVIAASIIAKAEGQQ